MRHHPFILAGLLGLGMACTAGERAPEWPRVDAIVGLANVDNAAAGGDAVWATTTQRSDRFSPGPADASIVRITGADRVVTTIATGLAAEPVLVEVDDRLWAAFDDHLLVFDGSGAEIARVEVDASGTLIAGDGRLWATAFAGGVSVIDPETFEVTDRVDTVRFPTSPVVAFGYLWVASTTDGTLTVIDAATLGGATSMTISVSAEQQTDLTAVPAGATGPEVWVTDLAGGLHAVSAGPSFGSVRPVATDRAINQVVPVDRAVVLLPTWGRQVIVYDVEQGTTVHEVDIETIPVRGVERDGEVWVTGDGIAETITRVDVEAGEVVEQIAVGMNESETTGPTTPIVFGDEVWVPNRGDDAMFVITP